MVSLIKKSISSYSRT